MGFSKKVVSFIFYPSVTIHNLVQHYFDFADKSLNTSLNEHDGLFLSDNTENTDDSLDIENDYEVGRLYITVDKNLGIISFFLNGKNVTHGIKTIMGILLTELFENGNKPMSEDEVLEKADKLYPSESLYASSNRCVYDARRKFNNKIKDDLGITRDFIVKTKGEYCINKSLLGNVTLRDL